MRIAIRTSELNKMKEQASSTYPEECCGFLIGTDGVSREVLKAVRADNAWGESRERRYMIDSEALLRIERELDGTDLKVLGFYHSHPDHPAEPSVFDLEGAWPWYSYVIISVHQHKVVDLKSWSIDEKRGAFKEHPIEEV